MTLLDKFKLLRECLATWRKSVDVHILRNFPDANDIVEELEAWKEPQPDGIKYYEQLNTMIELVQALQRDVINNKKLFNTIILGMSPTFTQEISRVFNRVRHATEELIATPLEIPPELVDSPELIRNVSGKLLEEVIKIATVKFTGMRGLCEIIEERKDELLETPPPFQVASIDQMFRLPCVNELMTEADILTKWKVRDPRKIKGATIIIYKPPLKGAILQDRLHNKYDFKQSLNMAIIKAQKTHYIDAENGDQFEIVGNDKPPYHMFESCKVGDSQQYRYYGEYVSNPLRCSMRPIQYNDIIAEHIYNNAMTTYRIDPNTKVQINIHEIQAAVLQHIKGGVNIYDAFDRAVKAQTMQSKTAEMGIITGLIRGEIDVKLTIATNETLVSSFIRAAEIMRVARGAIGSLQHLPAEEATVKVCDRLAKLFNATMDNPLFKNAKESALS